MIFKQTALVVMTVVASARLALAQCESGVRVRLEWRDVPQSYKDRYVAAVKILHSSGRYNQLTQMHADNLYNWHLNSQFLPAHRQLLLDYEKALLEIDPLVVIPYYDWSLDAADLKASPFWDDMGRDNLNTCLTQGVFGSWNSSVPTEHCVTRGINWGDGQPIALYSWEIMKSAFESYPDFSVFQNWLTEVHDYFHFNVGGDLRSIPSSPSDPIFYLHHAFVDKLWWDWQQYDPTNRLQQYNGFNFDNSPVSLSDIIQPFNVGVESVMDLNQLCYMYYPPGTEVVISNSVSLSRDSSATQAPPQRAAPAAVSNDSSQSPDMATSTNIVATRTAKTQSPSETAVNQISFKQLKVSNRTLRGQPLLFRRDDSDSTIRMPIIPSQVPPEFYIRNNMTGMIPVSTRMHQATKKLYQYTYDALKSGRYLGGPGTGRNPGVPTSPYGKSVFGGPAPYSRVKVQSVRKDGSLVIPESQIQQVVKTVYPNRHMDFGASSPSSGNHAAVPVATTIMGLACVIMLALN